MKSFKEIYEEVAMSAGDLGSGDDGGVLGPNDNRIPKKMGKMQKRKALEISDKENADKEEDKLEEGSKLKDAIAEIIRMFNHSSIDGEITNAAKMLLLNPKSEWAKMYGGENMRTAWLHLENSGQIKKKGSGEKATYVFVKTKAVVRIRFFILNNYEY